VKLDTNMKIRKLIKYFFKKFNNLSKGKREPGEDIYNCKGIN